MIIVIITAFCIKSVPKKFLVRAIAVFTMNVIRYVHKMIRI